MPNEKKLTPQSQIVWDYLKTGRSLTNLIASATLRIGSVSRRMTEVLRNEEVHAYLEAFNQEITKSWDKDGTGRRYIKYQVKPRAA